MSEEKKGLTSIRSAFTDIFIERPVLAFVISLLIATAGIQAINTLTVRQYPRTEIATVVIRTVYIGADAELVRGFITTPLERAIASADGIEYISSESQLGLSTINVRLRLNYDTNAALAEISSKVDQVRGDLPPEAEVPTINIETADSTIASAYLSFSSEVLQANQITDYLVRVIQPRLTAVPGVQRAEILGERTFAMRIWLDPDRMAALGVSPARVRQVLASNNFLAAVGQTKGNLVTVNLTADTDLSSTADFEEMVITVSGGSTVRLRDIATVELGAENYNAEVRFSGQRAVFIGVWVLPNANTIDVIRDVRAEMERIQAQLPEGIEATFAYDSTLFIEQAINEVVKTFGITLVIVLLVIFFFMGRVRTVLVPVIAIPLSLIGAIFLIQVFGFTINLLTLLALVLAIGIVVDDAIVVVENIERNLRRGLTPKEAALVGVRELIGPVVATTLTLVAVYTPIALQGGLTGTLFREFALTLAGAVIVSSVVALTFSPMLSSKLLKLNDRRGLEYRINQGFALLRTLYGKVLAVTLDTRWAIYTAWVFLLLLTFPMFMLSPTELAPTEDQGVIFGIVEAPPNFALEQTVRYTEAANDIFFEFPETSFSFQITFPSGGFAGMVLDPWEERERSTFELQPLVQQRLATIPGINIFPVTPPALPGGSNFPVEFILVSTAEPEQILEFARQLQSKAMQSGMFAFPPIIDTRIDRLQSQFVIDRDKVAALGLDLRSVGLDLSSMVSGGFVNRFNIDGRSYKVIPQVERARRLNPEQLKEYFIAGPEGRLIPLSTVATLEETVQPRSLKRFQQFNAVKLEGVAIRPLDEALRFLEDEARAILPDGYAFDYGGESRQLRVEGDRFLPAFNLAMILIFLVLAAQFNSFRDPFIILLGSVPLAIFGALIFTFLRILNPNVPFFTDGWTTTLNIYSQVGLVTLVGLVAKNGILIVQFANALQLEGKPKREAIQAAAEIRLRPILMTASSTIFGLFALILATGAGAEARSSMGLIIVGGLAFGTFFTLLFLPSIYMLLGKDHQKHALAAKNES